MTERVTREHGIVSDGAPSTPAAPGVAAEAWDSHANVLSNLQRLHVAATMAGTQGLVAWCSSLALSVACVTERVSHEHGIVSDGAGEAPAAPDVVADVWNSLHVASTMAATRACCVVLRAAAHSVSALPA